MLSLLGTTALLFSAVGGLTIPQMLSGYDPVTATCPSSPLVRPATGLSTSEITYLTNRKIQASAGLASWLKKTNAGVGTSRVPNVALTTSGGGYRSLLCGAGVIQGLDSRDSNVEGNHLLQTL